VSWRQVHGRASQQKRLAQVRSGSIASLAISLHARLRPIATKKLTFRNRR
jgi:hypothetical protein